MVALNGIHLAVNLIRTHFGDAVAAVLSTLLNKGSLSLDTLAISTSPNPNNPKPKGPHRTKAKRCLQVLIQHNCVQAFSVLKLKEKEMVPVVHYMALLDNVLHQMRFFKFVAVVKARLGPECEKVLQLLLQHGRLTFEQLVERAVELDPRAERDVLRANLNELIRAHYVERCPRPEPFIELSAEAKPKRSSSKKSSKSVEANLSIEQKAMIAAAFSDAERFSEIMDMGTINMSEVEEPQQHPGVLVGDKRKHEDIEVDTDTQATITNYEVLWRVNFEKFVHSLKKKACAENVRSRLSPDAGIVLEAMLESSEAKDESSVTSSMDSILEGVRGKPGGISMTMEHIRRILDQLGCRLCTEEAGALYSIDLKRIIETCQNEEVENLVSGRFGKDACRIFRLLIKSASFIETERISDIAFVDKKEAQKILFKLWTDNYIDMQRANTEGDKLWTQVFSWGAKKHLLWEHVLNDMYHAALNLRLRAAHLLQQEPELLSPVMNLSETLRKQKVAQQKRWMTLQSSLSKLDDAILLFRYF